MSCTTLLFTLELLYNLDTKPNSNLKQSLPCEVEELGISGASIGSKLVRGLS